MGSALNNCMYVVVEVNRQPLTFSGGENMSTRSAIAYGTPKEWQGVYSHYDGYPEGVGAMVWKVLMTEFVLNQGRSGVVNDGSTALQSFVDIYINGHPGGWSSFANECYCHSPDFVMRDGVRDGSVSSDDNPDALFIEWVYIVDVQAKKLHVLVAARARGYTTETNDAGESWKHTNYKHYHVVSFDIDADIAPPKWKVVQEMGAAICRKKSKMYESTTESVCSDG